MELALNLIWLGLSVGALLNFLRKRHCYARTRDAGDRPLATGAGWGAQVSFCQALVALVCVLVLLFPVISASDDLHPTAQAVMEDASKRGQLRMAPLNLVRTNHPPLLLAATASLYRMAALVTLREWRPAALGVRTLDGILVLCAGRAPPSWCN